MPAGHELFLELTGNFIHACREIHHAIGFSLPQEAYKKALDYELTERKMKYVIDETYDVEYKDRLVYQHKIDFVVDDKVLIQIVSIDGEIPNELIGQIISARNVSGLDVALIINFGNDKLQIRRLEKRKQENNVPTAYNNASTPSFTGDFNPDF